VSGAGGRIGDIIDGVSAAGRAMGELMILEIGREVVFRGGGVAGLSIFQSPFLFGGLDHAHIIDAGVVHGGVARFDKVRNGDGHQQRNKEYCPHNGEVTGNQTAYGKTISRHRPGRIFYLVKRFVPANNTGNGRKN